MDLTEKLANVRRAGRLVAAYNRRVMSILGIVERTLEQQPQLGLAFNKWSSTHFNNIGKQTTAVVGRWGWDFLNLYDAWFRWTRDGKTERVVGGAKERSVSARIRHIMDDGFARGDGTEPDPRDFVDADQAGSWLEIELLCVLRGTSDDTWDQLEAARATALDAGEERWSGDVVTVPIDGVSNPSAEFAMQHVGWRVPMSDVDSAESVAEQVETRLSNALERIVVAPED